MSVLPPSVQPEIWLAHCFAAKAVTQGGVIRRKLRDVDRLVGRDRFLAEVQRRGFHAVENADQIVVFCNTAPIRLLC